MERLKLEAKYAPRLLSDTQAAALLAGLSALKGKRVDIVSYEGLGSDVALLAAQLAGAMMMAGLDAPVFTPLGGSGIVIGVKVTFEVGSPSDVRLGAMAIVGAIRAAGIATVLDPPFAVGQRIASGYTTRTDKSPDAKIRVLVGAKPPQ